jgi:nuclear protein localization family protein 4
VYCQNCQPLTEAAFSAKKCDRHEPWPKGICSYCKPDSAHLMRQEYRHVDHVVFENAQVLGSLIEAWRSTGSQRCGFLFGRYLPHKDIPLGIKAVVEAIYEPPQINSVHGLQLKEDPDEDTIVKQAQMLGLEMIGFAWTAIEVQKGKIIKSRDLDKTYLASGAEMLQAALFQNEHPSKCRHSMSGQYGSKFFSVLITGTEEGEIAPLVFQVSDQLAGMTRDGVVTHNKNPLQLQTVDNPNVYVPTVLYDDTNEYNRVVVREAKPTFPPIPCWVDVNFAAPKSPNPLLPTHTFPVENRPWQPFTEDKLVKQVHMAKPLDQVFGDFHFFLYLGKVLDEESFAIVAHGIKNRDTNALKEALKRLKPLLPETGAAGGGGGGGGAAKKPASGGGGGGKHPQEDEWTTQLMSMGFGEAQSRAALKKSHYQGVEAALGSLI